ncbi:unnamed protein product [Cylindrotheca closterium]|uniref:Uncharacterized protein n=1 Tax=Cylindrotheca closterium TaxID=2856 RepID=A0AAD2FZ74_9STRA|nr:unnamed protein product [Cylindrotheca closterium]
MDNRRVLGSDGDAEKTRIVLPTSLESRNEVVHDRHGKQSFQEDHRQGKKRKIESTAVDNARGLMEPRNVSAARTNPLNQQQADMNRLNDLLRLQQGYQQQDSAQSSPQLQLQMQLSHQQSLQQQGATDRKSQTLVRMSPSGGYQVYTGTFGGATNSASPLPQPRPLRPMTERPLLATSCGSPQSFLQDSNQRDASSPQEQKELQDPLPSQISGLQDLRRQQAAASLLPTPILPQDFQLQLSALNNQLPNSLLNHGFQQNPPFDAPLSSRNYAAAMDAFSSAALLPIPMREPPMGSSSHPGKKPVTLYIPCDDESLSPYQCLVRKNIELFEADMHDVEGNAKGRNKPIVLGQVGIRCKHCSAIPSKNRGRGSKYYPAKLSGLYQAAQGMASGHLCSFCNQIPSALRNELMILREKKSSAGGGKKYWADGVRVLGVIEDEHGLRFKKN